MSEYVVKNWFCSRSLFVFLAHSHRENFLQFRGHAPPARLAAVLMFLLELLKRNNDTDPALLTVPLANVLRCVMLVNEPQGGKCTHSALYH